MRWSARESTCVSQMTVTTPRLNPMRLPCVGKCSSSKRAMPMRCIWASNSGMSSTRSVRIVNGSFISSVYQNLWIASKFTRTVRINVGKWQTHLCIETDPDFARLYEAQEVELDHPPRKSITDGSTDTHKVFVESFDPHALSLID